MKYRVVAAALILTGCGESQNQASSKMAIDAPPPATVNSPSAQKVADIDPNVFEPYSRDSYPKTFVKWGTAGVRRIDALRAAAARTVATNSACDKVEISELSDNRSAAPNRPIVFVDCANGQRFYLGESDVETEVTSETSRGARLSKSTVIELCERALRAQLNVPLSMDRDWLNTSAFQAQTTGRWVVDFTFKAQNLLGAKLPGSAHCTVGTDGTPEVTITQ